MFVKLPCLDRPFRISFRHSVNEFNVSPSFTRYSWNIYFHTIYCLLDLTESPLIRPKSETIKLTNNKFG